MLNVLFEQVNWQTVDHIGFDMDGTLYDEYEFIIQPYSEISKKFLKPAEAFSYICNRWLEKGSSYNRIFDEAFDKFELLHAVDKDQFIADSLNVFRSFSPEIQMNARVTSILEFCKHNYQIFLVTDGNPILQKKKFQSLGLEKYFNEKQSIFTGAFANDFHKPNGRSAEMLNIDVSRSVFFGDRDVDRNYAGNCGMQFQQVYNMIGINE